MESELNRGAKEERSLLNYISGLMPWCELREAPPIDLGMLLISIVKQHTEFSRDISNTVLK